MKTIHVKMKDYPGLEVAVDVRITGIIKELVRRFGKEVTSKWLSDFGRSAYLTGWTDGVRAQASADAEEVLVNVEGN